jgi:hypothetical protein
LINQSTILFKIYPYIYLILCLPLQYYKLIIKKMRLLLKFKLMGLIPLIIGVIFIFSLSVVLIVNAIAKWYYKREKLNTII